MTVGLFDVNGKEVERLDHRSNAFGSFSGSMIAPADRLAGRMTIRVISGPRGASTVQVEQYKRPKFKTELEAPEVAAKLNDKVTIKGKAVAYSGAPIDDADVSWRVVRSVHYPTWWYRFCWWAPVQSNSQEIAQGSARIDADGRFEITFPTLPDQSVPKASEPFFQYQVYADVTDATGETRSASKSTRIGYTALAAKIETESWLVDSEPSQLKIQTQTFDGVGQAASGKIHLYSIKQPKQVARKTMLSPGHRRHADDKPDAIDPANPLSWPTDEEIQTIDFETNVGGDASIEVGRLPSGIYRAVLETKDRFGKAVSAKHQFTILDPDSSRTKLKLPDLLVVKNSTVEPGGRLSCSMGIWLRNDARFRRTRKSRKNAAAVLDAPQPDAMDDHAERYRNDARRGDFANHDGSRQPSLFQYRIHPHSLDEQTVGRHMGTLCLQAGTGTAGNVESKNLRPHCFPDQWFANPPARTAGRVGGDSLRRLA